MKEEESEEKLSETERERGRSKTGRRKKKEKGGVVRQRVAKKWVNGTTAKRVKRRFE